MPETEQASTPVGRVPPPGATVPSPGAGDGSTGPSAGSGDPAYKDDAPTVVGRLPPAGGCDNAPSDPPPCRLRRLHRVWPDREGNISYLLTLCVENRARVLDNDATFQRLTAFLLDSGTRYRWFPRRFIVMPDHLHLIAHQGGDAVRLGQWIKALKAVAGGLERRADSAGSGLPAALRLAQARDPAYKDDARAVVGRVPSPGVTVPSPGGPTHEFTRLARAWRWQRGFHDHKFRTPESEQRRWEYVCLNPVRYGLVERPEQWPFGGEVFYEDGKGPVFVKGTPPLLETGMLMVDDIPSGGGAKPPSNPPAGGSRPTA